MDFLGRLLGRRKPSADDTIINAAMALSLEWGANYNQPIQTRLMQQFPSVTQAQADALEKLCNEIKRFAFDLYFQVPQGRLTDVGVQNKIRARYPFLNRETINRLSVQGMYYAHK